MAVRSSLPRRQIAAGDVSASHSLSIDAPKAQRGPRRTLNGVGELKQAFGDVTFLLETNSRVPAAVRLKVRRPTDSADLFYIGSLQGVRQFQFFDVARGGAAVFELLRDSISYERWAAGLRR